MDTFGLDTDFGTLWLVETYFYYDWPIEFAAISTTGKLFLVQWVGKQQSENGSDWLLLLVSRTRLEEFRRGELDHRDALLASESGVVYLVHTGAEALPLKVLDAASLPEKLLPPAGEALNESEPLPSSIQTPFGVITLEEAAE